MPRLSKTAYIKKATKRFLDGTNFRSPIDAVEAGARSLEEWSEILFQERELELEQLKQVRLKRRAITRKLGRTSPTTKRIITPNPLTA